MDTVHATGGVRVTDARDDATEVSFSVTPDRERSAATARAADPWFVAIRKEIDALAPAGSHETPTIPEGVGWHDHMRQLIDGLVAPSSDGPGTVDHSKGSNPADVHIVGGIEPQEIIDGNLDKGRGVLTAGGVEGTVGFEGPSGGMSFGLKAVGPSADFALGTGGLNAAGSLGTASVEMKSWTSDGRTKDLISFSYGYKGIGGGVTRMDEGGVCIGIPYSPFGGCFYSSDIPSSWPIIGQLGPRSER